MSLLELALIVSLCAFSVPGGAAQVIQHPQTKLVLLGQNATFTCKGIGDAFLLINSEYPVGNAAVNQKLEANNISWTKVRVGSVTTFTVTILATLNNNYTNIWCNFGVNYATNTARMIAVTGPPGPPGNFTIQVTNMTALTLTWTAPWPHPISNYTITMLNLSSGQESQWTASEEKFVVRGGGGGQCDELQFTVKAVTEVGNSTGILPARKGFPMGMTEVNVSVENLKKTDGSLKMEVRVEVLLKCSYETWHYIFTLRDLSSNTTVHNSCTTTPALDIDSVALPGKDYEVKVRVQNEAGMTTSAVKTFNSGFQDTVMCTTNTTGDSVTAATHPTGNATATHPTDPTDSFTSTTHTTDSTKGPTASASNGIVSPSEALVATTIPLLMGVAGGVGGVILLLLVLAVVLCSLLLRRISKRKRQTVVTTEDAEQGTQAKQTDQKVAKKSKKLNIPQVMAANPMYEASTPIYDCIMGEKELKIIGGKATEWPACGTLPLDIPPQLPVRKNTLESPGVKSTTQLVMEKRTGDSEEYMYMKSAPESRYTKTPLAQMKMAGKSTTPPNSEKE